MEKDNFIYFKLSNDGTKCDEFKDDYYFDDEGKGAFSNFCSKDGSYKCDKCKERYYFTQYGEIYTTEDNYFSGRSDIRVFTSCKNEFCKDFKDGKYKSNIENNNLQFCRISEGKCTQCIYSYYLTREDKKCCKSSKCIKS